MMSFSFVVPGRAVALMRPRINMGAIRRFKGAGRGGGPLVYTPYKCKKWQKLVQSVVHRTLANPLRDLPLFTGYIDLRAKFYIKRPGKTSKFALRPDIDNYAKNLLDALDGLLYIDDAFVTKLDVEKEFVESVELERTECMVIDRRDHHELEGR